VSDRSDAAPSGFSGPHYYDECLGPAWFAAHADDLARRLPHRPAGDVLEIACGTGLVTDRLRARLDPALGLVATDASAAMLDYARAKRREHGGIEWREADAFALPFDAGRFGAVVCGLGFMFVPDRVAALREARRVLVDDGLLLFNVWDRIENNPAAVANADVLEELFPDDPDVRFPTPFEMCETDLLRALLAEARFHERTIEVVRIPIAGADPRAIATGQIRGTPRSALIAQRGVSLASVIDRVAAVLQARGGDPYHGFTQAVVVEASAV
jgi:SAM-dependent methyltransferase